uniref:Integrase catalytic domain-containing protein n=1 Tax=Strongyloides venezuelensis TaxID=75913 RepID=A0A0K0FI09_STRVS
MYLKSDRAKCFESEKLAEFAKKHFITLEKGTAYKQTSHSPVERSFRTLHQLMSKSIEEQNYNKWDALLLKLTFIYNSSIHPESGRTSHDIFLRLDSKIIEEFPYFYQYQKFGRLRENDTTKIRQL